MALVKQSIGTKSSITIEPLTNSTYIDVKVTKIGPKGGESTYQAQFHHDRDFRSASLDGIILGENLAPLHDQDEIPGELYWGLEQAYKASKDEKVRARLEKILQRYQSSKPAYDPEVPITKTSSEMDTLLGKYKGTAGKGAGLLHGAHSTASPHKKGVTHSTGIARSGYKNSTQPSPHYTTPGPHLSPNSSHTKKKKVRHAGGGKKRSKRPTIDEFKKDVDTLTIDPSHVIILDEVDKSQFQDVSGRDIQKEFLDYLDSENLDTKKQHISPYSDMNAPSAHMDAYGQKAITVDSIIGNKDTRDKLTQLLEKLELFDQAKSNEHCYFIGTTNDFDQIDPELRKRFEHVKIEPNTDDTSFDSIDLKKEQAKIREVLLNTATPHPRAFEVLFGFALDAEKKPAGELPKKVTMDGVAGTGEVDPQIVKIAKGVAEGSISNEVHHKVEFNEEILGYYKEMAKKYSITIKPSSPKPSEAVMSNKVEYARHMLKQRDQIFGKTRDEEPVIFIGTKEDFEKFDAAIQARLTYITPGLPNNEHAWEVSDEHFIERHGLKGLTFEEVFEKLTKGRK